MPFDSVFGSVPSEDEIFIPSPDPFNVRNNCQLGRWTIGGEEYAGSQYISIVKFCRYFGDLGMTENVSWGQLWFVVESGTLPRGIVCCTYIKKQSLANLISLVFQVQAKRVCPEEGVFQVDFAKCQNQIIDATGSPISCSYYVLEWKWSERNEAHYSIDRIEQASQADLADEEGTRNMVRIDGLDLEQRSLTIARFRQKDRLPQLKPGGDNY